MTPVKDRYFLFSLQFLGLEIEHNSLYIAPWNIIDFLNVMKVTLCKEVPNVSTDLLIIKGSKQNIWIEKSILRVI